MQVCFMPSVHADRLPRQYTYRFAGKIAGMIPTLREDSARNPVPIEAGLGDLSGVIKSGTPHPWKFLVLWESQYGGQTSFVVKPFQFLWQVSPEPLQILFANMTWAESADWDMEADLRRVVRYARGSKRLSIPGGWREFLPKELSF